MNHPRILIAEDEADAREMLCEGLARHGFAPIPVADGMEAVAHLDSSLAAVVTDLVMPRMDGIELLRRIPRHAPQALRVVVTSFADKTRAIAALNLGADYLLEKPFTARQLAELLQRLLEDRGDSADAVTIFARRLAHLGLTEREQVIVTLALKGLSNHDIAVQTSSSEGAVKNAFLRLYQRLGIGSRGELCHLIFPI